MSRAKRRSDARNAIALLALTSVVAGCGEDSAPTESRDLAPPDPVLDLSAELVDEATVRLEWTAPGDDGTQGRASEYDVRYADTETVLGEWTVAEPVSSPPSPGVSGSRESMEIVGLPVGKRYFALRVADEVPNWSEISNTVSITVPEGGELEPIQDLEVVDVGATGASLAWTVPFEGASKYDLRHSSSMLDEENWSEAKSVEGLPIPGAAGSVDTFAVAGLAPASTYFFGLRVSDAREEWTSVSNVVTTTTLDLTPRRLTFSSRIAGAVRPSWSPDGRRIVFNADWVNRQQQIFTIPATGGDSEQLTSEADGASSPSWSPTGSQVAFLRQKTSSIVLELVLMEPTAGAPIEVLVSYDGGRSVSRPAWSPDGNYIAYSVTTWNPTGGGASDLFVVSTAGGTPELLFAGQPLGALIFGVSWSRDGKTIAFDSDHSGNNDIWTIPASGGEPTQVTSDPGDDIDPVWSPDGTRLAFVSDRSGNYEIWSLDSATGSKTQLTSGTLPVGHPTWSPSGRTICFVSFGGISDLWVQDVE